MEVRGIGQGGQTQIEVSKNAHKTAQVNDISTVERVKGDEKVYPVGKAVSEKELKSAVDKLNKFLEDNRTHAEYEYHDKLKQDLMIKIIDDKTGEVIREVPPKKILDMVAKMLEVVGVLIDKKA